MARPAPTFEALRQRFERASHSVDRAHAAARARAVARRLDVAVPPWAALGHARRDRLDLEALRERHDRGALPPDRRARLRMLARQRAEAAGLAIPAWAATHAKAPRANKRRSIAITPRSISLPRVAPRKTPLPGRTAQEAPARSIPAPLEIPAPLRAWRAVHSGRRVVQLTRERVTLHERGAQPRSFASVAEAIAALA